MVSGRYPCGRRLVKFCQNLKFRWMDWCPKSWEARGIQPIEEAEKIHKAEELYSLRPKISDVRLYVDAFYLDKIASLILGRREFTRYCEHGWSWRTIPAMD